MRSKAIQRPALNIDATLKIEDSLLKEEQEVIDDFLCTLVNCIYDNYIDSKSEQYGQENS